MANAGKRSEGGDSALTAEDRVDLVARAIAAPRRRQILATKLASAETVDAVEVETRIAASPETVFDFFVEPGKMIQWMGRSARRTGSSSPGAGTARTR